MRLCSDCGGDVGRGWTNPSDHEHCCPCATARALGSPIPERETRAQRLWRGYLRKLELRKASYHAKKAHDVSR